VVRPLPTERHVVATSSYPASIDLSELKDEQQAAFVMYLQFLVKRALGKDVLSDKLFGVTRRAVERWMASQRYPKGGKEWNSFLQSEGSTRHFTEEERRRLDRLRQKELVPVDARLDIPEVDLVANQRTPFFERLHERWLLSEMVRDPHYKSIGITGRAGIGKTALLHRFLSDIAVGPWQILREITPIAAVKVEVLGAIEEIAFVDRMVDALATMLHQKRPPQRTPENQLNALWDIMRHAGSHAEGGVPPLYLLVIDNAEWLMVNGELDPTAQLFFAKLDDAPTHFKCLTLSRFDLTPYLPVRHALITLEQGLSVESGAAYLRALDPNNAAHLQGADAAALRQLVEYAEGVPKQLENLVTDLRRNRFPPLEEFLRRLPQREMRREQVRQLYDHLDEPTRRMLQITALLDAHATVDAIAHVGEVNRHAAEIYGSQLIDLNLVQRFDRMSGHLHLHPLDQELAYQQMDEELRRQLHQRAGTYFQQQAPDAKTARSRNDLGAHILAFEHLLKAEAYPAAARWYYGTYADRLRQMEYNTTLLRNYERLLGHLDEPELQAANGLFASIPLFLSGKPQECLAQLAAAEAHAREADSSYWLARILSNAALIHSYTGQTETALRQIAEAEQICEQYQGAQAEWIRAQMLMRQTVVYLRAGRHDDAIASARGSMVLTDDPEVVAAAQGNIGTILFNRGQYGEALQVYEQLLETAKRHELRFIYTTTLSNIGAANLEMGRIHAAQRRYEEARQITAELLGDKRLQGAIANNLIEVYALLNLPEETQDAFHEALDLAEQTGLTTVQAVAYGEFGWALVQQGKYGEAEQHLQTCYRLGESHPQQVELARFGAYWVCVLLLQGKDAEAWQRLEQLPESHNAVHQAFIHLLRAITLARRGERDQAVAEVNVALAQTADMMEKSPQLYRPYYLRVLALATRALLRTEPPLRQDDLLMVETAYRQARTVAGEPGFMAQARLLLGLLASLGEEADYRMLANNFS
jgi:tetratricopeptide (TPR) repeat protein